MPVPVGLQSGGPFRGLSDLFYFDSGCFEVADVLGRLVGGEAVADTAPYLMTLEEREEKI